MTCLYGVKSVNIIVSSTLRSHKKMPHQSLICIPFVFCMSATWPSHPFLLHLITVIILVRELGLQLFLLYAFSHSPLETRGYNKVFFTLCRTKKNEFKCNGNNCTSTINNGVVTQCKWAGTVH